MRISKALLFSIASGMVFTAVFLSYPNDIGRAVYKSERVGDMIYLLAFSCTFIYLQQTLIGILNGLARQGVLLINTFMGFVIRYGAIFLLIPVLGVKGYIYGFILGSIIVCIFNFSFLSKSQGVRIMLGKWIIIPTLICSFLVFSSDIIRKFALLFLENNRIITILSIGIMVIVGYFLMFLLNVLDKNEFQVILNSSKIKKHDY